MPKSLKSYLTTTRIFSKQGGTGSVRVSITVKTLSGDKGLIRKDFIDESGYFKFLADLRIRGNNIERVRLMSIDLRQWSWHIFFETNPNYINERTWLNAIAKAKQMRNAPKYFKHCIYDREFLFSKRIYEHTLKLK